MNGPLLSPVYHPFNGSDNKPIMPTDGERVQRNARHKVTTDAKEGRHTDWWLTARHSMAVNLPPSFPRSDCGSLQSVTQACVRGGTQK